MGHIIDLSKYQLHTDLAIESISEKNIKGLKQSISKDGIVKITDVVVLKEASKIIHKKEGHYITLEFTDITDMENHQKVLDVFAKELIKLLQTLPINKKSSCLVIGLGNRKSTPDSLGPKVINNILVTNHLFILKEIVEGFRPVMALAPGVMSSTGLETADIISSIVKKNKPDFLIVIDALASQAVERVNQTIQMTDTGIAPGSGLGNHRSEISYTSIGKPVLVIGVPTVVDAVTIVSDTFNYIYKHFAYIKENIDNPLNKLLGNQQVNYLKKDIKVKPTDKVKLLGMIGTLNDHDIRQLLNEVLTPIGYNLMVTPKEIDFMIDKISALIAEGINQALHSKLYNLSVDKINATPN